MEKRVQYEQKYVFKRCTVDCSVVSILKTTVHSSNFAVSGTTCTVRQHNPGQQGT